MINTNNRGYIALSCFDLSYILIKCVLIDENLIVFAENNSL